MTLVDTNVLLDIATNDPKWAAWSLRRLDAAAIRGPVLINAVVYAEFSIGYARIEEVDKVLADADFKLAETPRPALFLAGKAFHDLSGARRRAHQRAARLLHWRARGCRRVLAADARPAPVQGLLSRGGAHCAGRIRGLTTWPNRIHRRVDHAAELDDRAVAGALDDAAAMGGDGRVDQIAAQPAADARACAPRRRRRAGCSRRRPRPGSPRACASRSLLRHPGLAQAVVRPLVHLDEAWIAVLSETLDLKIRLPCRDRLELPGGGQREVALQRLARFRIMTGQGERRHKDHMRIRDVIRIDRDRLASPVNRLIVTASARNRPTPCRRTNRASDGSCGLLESPCRNIRLVDIARAFVVEFAQVADG